MDILILIFETFGIVSVASCCAHLPNSRYSDYSELFVSHFNQKYILLSEQAQANAVFSQQRVVAQGVQVLVRWTKHS